ncbi:hypothetical protein ODJ79_41435 [Actinoplanes sp. KI2]|uniref:hypothetical protein n=1 Tax=Actinoplanes sp. KI2 TaxID=2983315 RepID=UPI0021D5C2F5|nr:hypothetical protein [Actinoplanes sp. KI2]MCU7730219.1 hypothetical protein [Actinoplanes sp. KI2]
MSGDGRLVRVLVACYPAGWRRRYGDEYAQLLCDLRIHRRPGLIADSLRGAVRAHGGVLMRNAAPMTVAVWAAGLFTVAGIGFAKLAEDIAGAGRTAYTIVVLAAGVALLALVAAAAPSGMALLRGRDAGAWKYVAVPFAGTALWFGVLGVASAIGGPPGFLLLAAAGIAVVAATAWAAGTVLRRVPAEQPPRLRPVALITVTGGMALATVAALIWGLQVRSTGGLGFLATPLLPSWLGLMVALGAATVLAGVAGRRQLRAAS